MNTRRFSAACRAVRTLPYFSGTPCTTPFFHHKPARRGDKSTKICPGQKGGTILYPFAALPLLFSILLLLLSALPIRAQTLDRVDPLETAFAGSTTARSGDARLAWRNPAALANPEKKFNILAAFAPSVLGVEGYREGSFIAAMTIGPRIAVGINGAGLGAGSYREFSGGVTTAGTVADNLRLGFTLSARTAVIDEYGSQIVPLIDLGAQIDVADGIVLGASFVNATRTTIADEEIPQRLAMGMLYAPDSTFSLSLDILQELRRDLAFGLGLSFVPLDDLTLRAGVASEPGTLGYGVGYRMGDIRVDYGGAYVSPLGFSHVFGVGVIW